MALDLSLRELMGGANLCLIGPFCALEAAVAATTAIPLAGTAAAADAGQFTAPFDGVIVGMVGNSEAGSNFTIQPTVDGTPDTTKTMTVNAANEYVNYNKNEYVSFTAGQALGMYCVADTTSKDFTGFLVVAFDLSDD